MTAGSKPRYRLLRMEKVGGADVEHVWPLLPKHRFEAIVCRPVTEILRRSQRAAADADHLPTEVPDETLMDARNAARSDNGYAHSTWPRMKTPPYIHWYC
jgi:hypothetical protein